MNLSYRTVITIFAVLFNVVYFGIFYFTVSIIGHFWPLPLWMFPLSAALCAAIGFLSIFILFVNLNLYREFKS